MHFQGQVAHHACVLDGRTDIHIPKLFENTFPFEQAPLNHPRLLRQSSILAQTP